MGRAQRRLLRFLLCLSVLALPLVAQSSPRWLSFRSEHLWVAYRSDLAPHYLAGLERLDRVLARLEADVETLEADFVRVEHLLRARYDVADLGRVPVVVYPSLAAYQRAANCLICAAHVGRPLQRPGEEELTLSFGAHLNAESRPSTILHEFTHIVDFATVPNAAFPLWYEGLASYVGDRLTGGHRREIVRQYLKLARRDHPLGLEDYLTRRGYGRWTYNLGENLIDLLVRRGGLERFLAFYRDLRLPELGELDALLGRHYGLGLAELRADWQEEIDSTPLSEEGRRAYRFKLDQIVVRWVYLRPLLKDPDRLERAYFSLWQGGTFNVAAAEFMRHYLENVGNLVPNAALRQDLLDAAEQLRPYVASYAEDPARPAALEAALERLSAACQADPAWGCARAYFGMVNAFVRWD